MGIYFVESHFPETLEFPENQKKLVMTNHNHFPERRKYTRFQVKDRSFVLNSKFGPIVDISMDGLTFLHVPVGRGSKETADTGVLFAGETPFCDPLPVKVVSDQATGSGGSEILRRSGVQFADLTQEQLSQLDAFIVKGQKWDLKKIKPTYEELAIMVQGLERDITKLEEKQKTDKMLEIDKLLKGLADENKMEPFLLICSYCKNIKDEQDNWQKVEKYVGDHFDIKFSHGLCPECSKKHYPKLFDSEK